MLPIKLDLTKDLAVKLRDIRLNNPVNGEILTAENLSKSIGNNRAWMSQIESRRLKKVKREDIISIYKLLFNISSDYDAENKAEMDLLNCILPNKKKKMIIGSIKNVEEHNKKISDSQTESPESDKTALLKLNLMYKESCENLRDELLYIYNEESNFKKKVMLSKFVTEFRNIMFDNPYSAFSIIGRIPLSNYHYASGEQLARIDTLIDDLKNALSELDISKALDNYDINLQSIMRCLAGTKRDFKEVGNIFIDALFNLSIIIFKSDIENNEKINYLNQLIMFLSIYSIRTSTTFELDSLPENTTFDEIKKSVNYIQSFINGIDNTNTYILHQISEYDDFL